MSLAASSGGDRRFSVGLRRTYIELDTNGAAGKTGPVMGELFNSGQARPIYQIVSTFEARILPSRLTNVARRATAVADTIRSGRFGTSSRLTNSRASATARSSGANRHGVAGSSRAVPDVPAQSLVHGPSQPDMLIQLVRQKERESLRLQQLPDF